MYIPKLRNATSVVEHIKKYDKETAVTAHLLRTLAEKKKLTCRHVGKARLFNLDECLQYFTGEIVFTKVKKDKRAQRKMRGTFEILNLFKDNDNDTFLTKLIVRRIAANEKKVFAFFIDYRKWLIDLDAFVIYFSGKTNQTATVAPRIRTYEESYHLIHRDYPYCKITWVELHTIVHSGDIFIIKHGNRWILNYDQLINKIICHTNTNSVFL